MRFFPIKSPRPPLQDRNTEPELADSGHPKSGEIDPSEVLAKSYVDLHDWRTKVEILRDAAKASQASRVVDLSLVKEIRLTGETLDAHLEDFDVAMGKLAAEDAVEVQELEALRSGFTKLRVAIDLLLGVLHDDPV
jgi:hypothetical protein